jgi:hypothetical protein
VKSGTFVISYEECEIIPTKTWWNEMMNDSRLALSGHKVFREKFLFRRFNVFNRRRYSSRTEDWPDFTRKTTKVAYRT